jgi:hypothetical protein
LQPPTRQSLFSVHAGDILAPANKAPLLISPLQTFLSAIGRYSIGSELQSGMFVDGVIGTDVPPGAKTIRKACASLKKVSGSFGQVKP